ncbi:SDR family oxidoreductase [Polynucleobacter sp. AP-Feld-500C-C5]|uniref:NAD-dependent epimerase/dehydratase family protein n=1 Tax=Polynucleobacter sp. AP-Feld-500C-C5 TaxID=2576924 RepID=UPI001C0B64F7|nr:SDR family oxidoreductase [Polynucleobacter sp. AP-Feld-500C-C5]
MKKVLVFGGAGYCGSLLVPQLLAEGWEVSVYDKMWYGTDQFPKNSKLHLIHGDVRDLEKVNQACLGHDSVLHLACISNDASFELDEQLSTSVNLNSFEPLVLAAKKAGVKRFVFASSSSVYGVSDSPNVTEDHPLVPLTLYNKYKGLCEPLLLKNTDKDFVGVIFRPATVCGYSPRQRLDLSVNILTNHAVNKNKILVFGGEQLRPNLHIQDYADLCKLLLSAPDDKIANQIFNVGFDNMSIMAIAKAVKKIVEEVFPEKKSIPIEVTESNDPRSYHINSEKIKSVLGFKPKYSVEDAVRDLCNAFQEGKLPNSFDDDCYYNVRTMKSIGAK